MPVSIQYIKKARHLEGKRVLVRIDVNVPIIKKKVLDDTRLKAIIPTIHYLLEKQARVILVGHLGRPEGKKKAALSLEPIARRLSVLLGNKVAFLPDYKGIKVETAIQKMKPSTVVMLENIRFSQDEEGNKGTLAWYLSSLADIYVNDAFSVSHRADASVVGIAPYLPSFGGLQLEKEIIGLEKITKTTKRPAILVIGGAKSETKIPVVKNFLNRADAILVGGALFNTYLFSLGYSMGNSLMDVSMSSAAKKYIGNKKVVKPIDVIVGTVDGKKYRCVSITKKNKHLCKKNEAVLDIGPKTIVSFAKYIYDAQTIVWNGAMGYFEQMPYDVGTKSLARLIAARSKGKAYGVIGGGETIQAMEQVAMAQYIDLVSTGGGAMLDFLSAKKLPGIEALVS